MVSAQTGQVGRSLPRGERGRVVDWISATAGIGDLLYVISPSPVTRDVLHPLFDNVATQIRFFYEFQFCRGPFALQQIVMASMTLAPERRLTLLKGHRFNLLPEGR
jgi:hypothetical protein